MSDDTSAREPWEDEIFYGHRSGWDEGRAKEEHTRLRQLWDPVRPLDESCTGVVDQIMALEICNWNLEESLMALCGAIGVKQRAAVGIGHMASMSEERWRRIWAYYLSCRNWLPCDIPSGYEYLLSVCDPDKTVHGHVAELLGERTPLKELYVERFCLCIGFWLGGFYPKDSAQATAYGAAVRSLEDAIREQDPDGAMLDIYQHEGGGILNLCHHKLFRRYDIILSSIGVAKWRGAMPTRGTDGFERAALLERYLSPIEAWLGTSRDQSTPAGNGLHDRIHRLLGGIDPAKRFLASLLVSLLRCQQLAARKRAESRGVNDGMDERNV
ncbi:MAG TPA: hypothetical protein HPP77_02045 [Candidatus Hydrogenedentes bacterium]|nr:hypothetical protein [Candidatus Hydrogenedentota bacterium]HIJ74155.1 hypothetical protein [Candidatus Hydrogenedentota bacterium]